MAEKRPLRRTCARTFPLVQLASRRSARPQVSTRALRTRHAQRQRLAAGRPLHDLHERLKPARTSLTPWPTPPLPPHPPWVLSRGWHRAGPLPCGAFWARLAEIPVAPPHRIGGQSAASVLRRRRWPRASIGAASGSPDRWPTNSGAILPVPDYAEGAPRGAFTAAASINSSACGCREFRHEASFPRTENPGPLSTWPSRSSSASRLPGSVATAAQGAGSTTGHGPRRKELLSASRAAAAAAIPRRYASQNPPSPKGFPTVQPSKNTAASSAKGKPRPRPTRRTVQFARTC